MTSVAPTSHARGKRAVKLAALLATGAMTATLFATPTLAQNEAQPGDIIVTAQRRAENLQAVPIAINAVSSEALQSRGLNDIADISKVTPSLNVQSYPNSSNTITLNMRGQGAGDSGQITKDAGVGLYIDGFYIARAQGAIFDIGDPERVEVLRGPQGTLWGRNTTGGAVNIVTKKPTGEFGVEATYGMGSRGYVRGLASINLPEIAGFSIKGTILYTDQNGFANNPGGLNKYGQHGDLAGRVAVRWQPTDTVTVDYAWDEGRVYSTQDFYHNPGLVGVIPGYSADRDTVSPPFDIPTSKTNYVDHQLTIAWDATDDWTFKSLSSYRGLRDSQYSNYGYAFNVPAMIEAGAEANTITQFNRYRTTQYSQELQAIGSIGDRLDLTLGAYYFKENGYHHLDVGTQMVAIPSFVDGDHYQSLRTVWAHTESYAAYGQATWTPPILDDGMKITVGGRYTHDKKDATRDKSTVVNYVFDIPIDNGVRNDLKSSNFSPSVNIAYNWTPDIMTYAKMSKGYKSGGSSEGAIDFTQTYQPEKVTSWEVGLKSQFWDRRATLNVAGFWNTFKNMQTDFVTDPFDTTLVSTVNAGSARVRGVEVDLTLQPIDTLTLTASYSYLDAKMQHVFAPAGTLYDPAVNPSSPFHVGDDVANLFAIPFAPKHALTLTGDWTFLEIGDSTFNVNAVYTYHAKAPASAGAGPDVVGKYLYYTDPMHNLDMRISYKHLLPSDGVMTFSVFAKNLANSRYAKFRTALGSPITGFVTTTEPWNQPRIFGAELRVTF